MRRFAINSSWVQVAAWLSLVLLLCVGCSPTESAPIETGPGFGENVAPVRPNSVVVEVRTIRSHIDDEVSPVTTVIDEWLLSPGEVFGPRSKEGADEVFRLDQIANDGAVIVELLTGSEENIVNEKVVIGSTPIFVDDQANAEQRHQLRVLEAADAYLPEADSDEVIERLASRTVRLTIDSVGSVQEVYYDWEMADQRDFPLLGQLKNLRHLSAPGLNFSGSSGRWLNRLKRLEKVDFRGGRLSRGGVETLAECKSLHQINLDDATISDGELDKLTRLNELESLSMKRTNVSLQSIWSLRRELSDCEVVGGSQFTWGRLKSPDGEQTVVELARYDDYSHLAQAKLLMAGVNLEANDLGFIVAADFRELPDRSITPAAEAIIGLRTFFTLTKLDLSESGCGSTGLINLAWLADQRRQFVDFNAPQVLIKELSLRGVSADPDAWRRLPAQKELELLDLAYTNIDDASVRSLALLSDIRSLDLTGVPIAEDTFEYLKDERPLLSVIR